MLRENSAKIERDVENILKRRLISSLLTIIILMIIYLVFISSHLTVTNYEVWTSCDESIRVVHLTDLHNSEFGTKNEKLVEKVKEQSPDMIFMTGDMLNRDEENISVITNLIKALVEIAPVYYGYGNHETTWEENWNRDLHEELQDTGVIVLDTEYVDVEVKGQKLRIGGYMGYWGQPHMMTGDKDQIAVEREFFGEFKTTDRVKLLLNHIPTQWVDWDYINTDSAGIVFSGHYHGGMLRIPFTEQGLFAPYVGWFPPYTKGVYEGDRATCILSTGLGSEYMIPRFNNPPEVVVMDLIPNKKSEKEK